MRKLLIGTLCALTLGLSSNCLPNSNKLEEITPTTYVTKTTKEGYKVILAKQGDSVSLYFYDPTSQKDTVQVVDNDFSKKNGVDIFSNFTYNISCNKNTCAVAQIKKANELFKYGLDVLGLNKDLKSKKGISGGW